MNNDEILPELDTSGNGLSCIIIDEKQEEYGKNIIDINNNIIVTTNVYLNLLSFFIILIIFINFLPKQLHSYSSEIISRFTPPSSEHLSFL